MVAQHLAVIGREHDQPRASARFAACLEIGDQRGDLVIEVLDQPEVAGLRPAQGLSLQQHAMPAVGPVRVSASSSRPSRRGPVREAFRAADGVKVLLRRKERRVRCVERQRSGTTACRALALATASRAWPTIQVVGCSCVGQRPGCGLPVVVRETETARPTCGRRRIPGTARFKSAA